jgi:hypothetical protein
MSIALDSLTPVLTNLTDVHLLFAVATNDVHASNGGTMLLDNIHFEPVPIRQQAALGLPLSTQTFGVIPQQTPASDGVPMPPDQVNRNVTTIDEAALTLLALLELRTTEDLALARDMPAMCGWRGSAPARLHAVPPVSAWCLTGPPAATTPLPS